MKQSGCKVLKSKYIQSDLHFTYLSPLYIDATVVIKANGQVVSSLNAHDVLPILSLVS